MKAEETIEEFLDSLTGFEELAIEKDFGMGISDLLQKKPTTGARALVFVQRRREGLRDADAKESALSMRLGDVSNFFPDDDEVTPDEPATEGGKEGSLPG